MKRVISCVLLMLVLTSNAFALEVPTDTVVQNLNGSQQAIKTFTVSPEQDPAALIEEPFELEGYLYTFADIVKSENPVEEKRIHTEVITVETTKDDLALILEQLKPTIEYDDGRFQGTLALDHTSLNTVAAGYATKNYTVTETKTIGQLDRNDMSYVPATTIKNGRTLSLANVEWQVTGTDLVGEALMPSQYQAVATYSAKASYQAATGYVTTAEYVGDVTHEGVESVTYVLTYIGTEVNHKGAAAAQVGAFFADHFPWILGGIVLICAAVGGTLLVCRRKAVVKVYGDNVFEKDGIRRDRTGDGEKTRCLCGKRGIFNRDGPAMGPQIIRQLERRASRRSASFFHALASPGRPRNGGGASGAYQPAEGRKALIQGRFRAQEGPLGPSRKSQQQTKRTGFAALEDSIADEAPEGKRAKRANRALNRAGINSRGQKQGFGGADRRGGRVTSR